VVRRRLTVTDVLISSVCFIRKVVMRWVILVSKGIDLRVDDQDLTSDKRGGFSLDGCNRTGSGAH
jgi:hypothetical protein